MKTYGINWFLVWVGMLITLLFVQSTAVSVWWAMSKNGVKS